MRRERARAAPPPPSPTVRRPRLAADWLGAWLVVLAFVWLSVGYALATPPWNNPDEPAHFNYVAHIAATGTLPVLHPGDWDPTLQAFLTPRGLLPGLPPEQLRYEAWQPPLYYLLATPIYLLAPPEPIDRLRLLRFFDVGLGAATLLLAFVLARYVFTPLGPAYRSLAVAVPAVMAGVPMFTAMSAAVSNDALSNFLAVALTLAALRTLDGLATSPPTSRTFLNSAAVGALLAAGLLTKLSLVLFLPVLAIALVGAAWRRRATLKSTLAAAAVAMLTCAALLLPWLIRQGLTYGWTDLLATRRHDAVVVGQPRFPGWDPAALWSMAQTLYHSFWAQFGWMAVPASDRDYLIWGILTLLALAGLLLGLLRQFPRPTIGPFQRLRPTPPLDGMQGHLQSIHQPGNPIGTRLNVPSLSNWPPIRWHLGLLALVALGALAEVAGYNLTFLQPQGRYLFIALAPLAILLVLGWSALAPARTSGALALAFAFSLISYNAFTLTRLVQPFFAQ